MKSTALFDMCYRTNAINAGNSIGKCNGCVVVAPWGYIWTIGQSSKTLKSQKYSSTATRIYYTIYSNNGMIMMISRARQLHIWAAVENLIAAKKKQKPPPSFLLGSGRRIPEKKTLEGLGSGRRIISVSQSVSRCRGEATASPNCEKTSFSGGWARRRQIFLGPQNPQLLL